MKTKYSITAICIVAALVVLSCMSREKQEGHRRFLRLDNERCGVNFLNEVIEDENNNPLQYENSYNGGGVAIADFNNDGLDDIYFTANATQNRLYLNRGNLSFNDVTETSKVQGGQGWKTGVAVTDINSDGLLDIYVTRSGNFAGPLRANELFVNQGNNEAGIPVFKELAQQYGLNDTSFSNHAVFFDYDRDGDIDMLLLNHSPIRFNYLDEPAILHLINTSDSLTGTKLFKNDNGYFRNVTASAGIRMSRLNYNLAASVSDVNGDGWPDIYISNDYLAPDYLYINNQDGTFTDRIEEMLSCTSQFSMGNDIADINNDGLMDILTLDMLPEDNRRQKLLFANDNYELFELRRKTGLHEQYMRNMLHLNNGNGTFSEIAQFSGISNTDWSWSSLFLDMDNDGWKDIFITNGYYRDYTNMDFLKYMGDYLGNKKASINKADLLELVKKMPSSRVRNYAYKNNSDLHFSDVSEEWKLDDISNSNGAAYGDLDNDGDLDLVVNNINEKASVYKNMSSQLDSNAYLRIRLVGSKNNTMGIGTFIQAYSGSLTFFTEQFPTRGFQSTVSPVLHFGLGKVSTIDSLKIRWSSGSVQVIKNIAVRTELLLYEKNASGFNSSLKKDEPLFVEVPSIVDFIHRENIAHDFKRQPLIPAALSYSGPCVAIADVNGDGLQDIYLGGAHFQAKNILLAHNNNKYSSKRLGSLADSVFEDTDALFADLDNDRDKDLVVCSGGYDNFVEGDLAIQTRAYFNDGNGNFSRSMEAFPGFDASASCVTSSDIDRDGDIDLFVGGRVIPGRYPEIPESSLLINRGNGKFDKAADAVAPGLSRIGLVTDAVFTDIDLDNWPDLIIVGEWMPVQIWKNKRGKFILSTNDYIAGQTSGWWNTIHVCDINNDRRMDIIAGNYGQNSQLKPSFQEPAEMYFKDFDDNGIVDPMLCSYIQGVSYPYVSRDELLDQISVMRRRFPDYRSYCNTQITDIFSLDELHGAQKLNACAFASAAFVSNQQGKYDHINLPSQVQWSPVFAIGSLDYNLDGKCDLLIGGNSSHSRVKMGNMKANYGILLEGRGDGSFRYIQQPVSGLNIKGDVRCIEKLTDDLFMFGINDGKTLTYRLKK